MRNIHSLDGLRAFSIVLVITGHLYNRLSSERDYTSAILGNASLGVTVFFVISGYLITQLLLKEFERDGAISLRSFYVRRAFRILPPYYFYLFVVCTLAALGWVSVNSSHRVSAFLFLWDYLPRTKTWSLEHLWSLSVEEQFYILWPATLILCLRRGREAGQRFALFCIVAAPVLRVLTHLTHSYYSTQLYFMMHTRMDALMFGCLAALAQGEDWFERIYRFGSRYVVLLASFVLFLSPVLALKTGGIYIYLVGYSLDQLCIVLTMMWLIRNYESAAGRLFNWAPVKKIGVISYSLYLWQTLFLHKENHSMFGRFPANLIAIFSCAVLSYLLIEMPSLKLRERFVRRSSRLMSKAATAEG